MQKNWIGRGLALALTTAIMCGGAAISNKAVALDNCTNAETIEKAMAQIAHKDCFTQGNFSRACAQDDALLCKDLQLVQRVCGTLSRDEVKHLKEVRAAGVTCRVPGH